MRGILENDEIKATKNGFILSIRDLILSPYKSLI
jgi:hypothetical protein